MSYTVITYRQQNGVEMSDWDFGDIAFFGFVGLVAIGLIAVIIRAIIEPSFEEKVALITEPRHIVFCENTGIDGKKIKAWRVSDNITTLYNMNGTKTTITAAGVCTFTEIEKTSGVLGE